MNITDENNGYSYNANRIFKKNSYQVYEYYNNAEGEYVQVFYQVYGSNDDIYDEIMRNRQSYHMNPKQALSLLNEYVDFDNCDCDCDDDDCDDCDCDDYDDDDDCDCDDYDDDDDCDCDDYDDDDDCDCDDYDDDDDCDCDDYDDDDCDCDCDYD